MKELAEPSIKEAFGKCVQQGASRIIVSPYFLSPGRHWNQVCVWISFQNGRCSSMFSTEHGSGIYLFNCLYDYSKTRVLIQFGTIFSQDIPSLASEASKHHSNVPYIITAPLGLHELMVVCAHYFSPGLC